MDLNVEEKRRKVIPRWRDFKTTLALGELNSLSRPQEEQATDASIDQQIEDWQNNKSLAFATDLVGAGFVVGKTEEIREAADFVLSEESNATELQRRIAHQAIDPVFKTNLSISDEIVASVVSQKYLYNAIQSE